MNKAQISFDLNTKKFIAAFGDVVIAKGNFREYVAAVIERGLSKKAAKLGVTLVEHINVENDPAPLKRTVKAVVMVPVEIFTVTRKKDGAVIASGVTKAEAEELVAKAAKAKKAALTFA